MSTMYDDANDFLLAGGSPSCTWPDVGTAHSGTIIDFRVEQARDFKTKEPKFWKDGNPVKQLVVTLQTNERDLSRDDDDGVRAMYCRGNLLKVVREAVRAHGGIAVGGKLGARFIGEGTAEPGLNPPKLFKAEYAPPAKTADLDVAMSGGGDEPLI